jgi:hypothetical protein
MMLTDREKPRRESTAALKVGKSMKKGRRWCPQNRVQWEHRLGQALVMSIWIYFMSAGLRIISPNGLMCLDGAGRSRAKNVIFAR